MSRALASSEAAAAAPFSSASVSRALAYSVTGCEALVAPEISSPTLATTSATAAAALADQQQELQRPKTALTATATATGLQNYTHLQQKLQHRQL